MRCFLTASVLVLTSFTVRPMAQDATAPLQIDPDLVANLLLKRVAPIYPPLARQARIQGSVVLTIVITKAGEVGNVQLFSGHPMLAPAAIQAVKQWRYRPYEQNGEPVEILATVQVNFKMPEEPAQGVVGDIPGGAMRLLPQVHVCEDSPAGSLPKRVRVSQGVMLGLATAKVAPEYPRDARNEHIEGTVLVDVEISRDGSVCDIALISGHPMLAESALNAVRKWKYQPYVLNGQPMEVETVGQVKFKLGK